MDETQSQLRSLWRIALLCLLLFVSVILIFGLGPAGGDAPGDNGTAVTNESVTDLRYGLDLAGGTRIRAPLIGLTAEGVTVSEGQTTTIERQVANHLAGVSSTDVTVYARQNSEKSSAVDVTAGNVTAKQFSAALQNASVHYESIRSGVTAETRDETVTVLENKITQGGLGGGSVREVSSASGEYFILVEVPDQSRSEVRDLISKRGVVRIDVYYPTETGFETREAVLESDDFQQIGTAQTGERTGPHVPVVLKSDAAERFEQTALDTNLAPSGSRCTYERAPNQTEACLLTLVDGEVVYSAGMSPSLARNIASGDWKKEGSFILQTEEIGEARELTLHLRAGSLPAKLDVQNGTSTYISPTQGDKFKSSSLIIGLLAVLAVSFKVFYRYRDIRVALPMVGVAMSEVVILLGFAAALKYPIDLSVVGGLIAVVGTGVDDLIIIANEVLAKGEVSSHRVFQSRFKKAFWVIMSAAVTTLIAMSPLVFLSLGDLRGFAIFTIIGVLVGVVITRPAYGDLLQKILVE